MSISAYVLILSLHIGLVRVPKGLLIDWESSKATGAVVVADPEALMLLTRSRA